MCAGCILGLMVLVPSLSLYLAWHGRLTHIMRMTTNRRQMLKAMRLQVSLGCLRWSFLPPHLPQQQRQQQRQHPTMGMMMMKRIPNTKHTPIPAATETSYKTNAKTWITNHTRRFPRQPKPATRQTPKHG